MKHTVLKMRYMLNYIYMNNNVLELKLETRLQMQNNGGKIKMCSFSYNNSLF